MFSKFKKGSTVLVYGQGKEEPIKMYNNIHGTVIEKDIFYFDYQIQFEDGSKDWFDEKNLRKVMKGVI